MADAIKLSYKSTEARPGDRPGSKFLSISGTSDIKPGLEITDESKVRHGAFTKSLLMVYKENLADIPVSTVLKKVKYQMEVQSYYQGMGQSYDKSRLVGNLIGITPSHFNIMPTTTCIRIMGNKVIINSGSNANIARGNIFSGAGGSKIQVDQVFADSSVAIIKNRGILNMGSKVELTDNYTISDPLVKLYIPAPRYSALAYDLFFNSQVKPIVNLEGYRDYENWKNQESVAQVFLNEQKPSIENAQSISKWGYPFYLFLPMPFNIYDAAKSQISLNQNVQLVDKEEKADYVLYVNYIKERPGTKSGFAFYFHPRMADKEAYGDEIFSENHAFEPTLHLSQAGVNALAKKIASLAGNMVRDKSNNWMNMSKRK